MFRIQHLRILFVIAVMLLSVPVFIKWPQGLLMLYAGVAAGLIVVYTRRVFITSWRMSGSWDSFVVDLASTDLTADSRFTRLRRRLSAALMVVAMATVWPKNWMVALLMRPFFRRLQTPAGMRGGSRYLAVLYGQFFVNTLLYALLPVIVLMQLGHSRLTDPLTVVLLAVLAINLIARHSAMLIYPHDMKVEFRRTAGEPRMLFLVLFCIDVLSFSVLLYAALLKQSLIVAGLHSFIGVMAGLIWPTELVTMMNAAVAVLRSGEEGMLSRLQAVLVQFGYTGYLRIIFSGFVYLNLVRMLFPVSSWKRSDDDLLFMARRDMVFRVYDEAQRALDLLTEPDAASEKLGALLATIRGDYETAARKARWAHDQEGLRDESNPDLVFLDAAGPVIFAQGNQVDITGLLRFAIRLEVSDVQFAVFVMVARLTGLMDQHQAAGLLGAGTKLPQRYMLGRAALQLAVGNAPAARAGFAASKEDDPVTRCAALFFAEIAGSVHADKVPDSLRGTAREVVRIVRVTGLDDLKLAQQLTLVSILTMLRIGMIYAGAGTEELARLSSEILANVRNHYPAFRDYASLQERYAAVAEAQARKQLVRPGCGQSVPVFPEVQ